MAKISKKQIQARIQKAYNKVGNGIQIPILSVTSIWKAGEKAILDGADDNVLESVLSEAILKVRTF